MKHGQQLAVFDLTPSSPLRMVVEFYKFRKRISYAIVARDRQPVNGFEDGQRLVLWKNALNYGTFSKYSIEFTFNWQENYIFVELAQFWYTVHGSIKSADQNEIFARWSMAMVACCVPIWEHGDDANLSCVVRGSRQRYRKVTLTWTNIYIQFCRQRFRETWKDACSFTSLKNKL